MKKEQKLTIFGSPNPSKIGLSYSLERCFGPGGSLDCVASHSSLRCHFHDRPLGAPPTTRPQSLKELIASYDTSRCKECHEEIYVQWEKSHHARSIMDIYMDGYLKKGVLAVKSPNEATRKNFPCFKCHFPQLEHAF